MELRTDLAVEKIPSDTVPEGVEIKKRGNVFDITEIIIHDDNCREFTGRGRGRYITLESVGLSGFSDRCEDMVCEIAQEFRRLLPDGDILVAGLGNRDITPDSIGPLTAEKVLATRHISNMPGDICSSDMRRVSTFAGGVLGQTGIETAELIRAVTSQIRPAAVIAVDALACSDIRRLGTTIQMTDTGISPGSGVSNARKELSRSVLGVPVIAVGIPTVVDMRTIAHDLTGQSGYICEPDMMVTPRDIDRLAERSSRLLAYGIDLALHPEFTYSEVSGLF